MVVAKNEPYGEQHDALHECPPAHDVQTPPVQIPLKPQSIPHPPQFCESLNA